MIDRRKFVRIPQSLNIAYEISNNPKTQFFLTRNISQGGVSFFTHEFIPKETILKIRFSLTEFSYDGFARVVWVREDTKDDRYEIGVEFMNTPKVS
ncbi:MAG: PilZ domain-containing protein [Candidatus Omnitrophica bacterium]|nr:PilZ domain-containing protein [Candidatus Omnitrophota bacterium]